MEFSFKADKSRKIKKFNTDSEQKATINKAALTAPSAAPKKQLLFFKNREEMFKFLSNKLQNKFNIDSLSVYAVSLNSDNGRLSTKKLFGAEVGNYNVEKYAGYDCPIILTSVNGTADNSSHRARFIERFGSELVIVSSSSYEAFRNPKEFEEIRKMIKRAFERSD